MQLYQRGIVSGARSGGFPYGETHQSTHTQLHTLCDSLCSSSCSSHPLLYVEEPEFHRTTYLLLTDRSVIGAPGGRL